MFLLHTASLLKAVKFTEYASHFDALCSTRLAGTQQRWLDHLEDMFHEWSTIV